MRLFHPYHSQPSHSLRHATKGVTSTVINHVPQSLLQAPESKSRKAFRKTIELWADTFVETLSSILAARKNDEESSYGVDDGIHPATLFSFPKSVRLDDIAKSKFVKRVVFILLTPVEAIAEDSSSALADTLFKVEEVRRFLQGSKPLDLHYIEEAAGWSSELSTYLLTLRADLDKNINVYLSSLQGDALGGAFKDDRELILEKHLQRCVSGNQGSVANTVLIMIYNKQAAAEKKAAEAATLALRKATAPLILETPKILTQPPTQGKPTKVPLKLFKPPAGLIAGATDGRGKNQKYLHAQPDKLLRLCLFCCHKLMKDGKLQYGHTPPESCWHPVPGRSEDQAKAYTCDIKNNSSYFEAPF
jgi:hypothetical protein